MALSNIANRKRNRENIDDEVSEFTPLSKRINNLHLNNSEDHRTLVEINEKVAEDSIGESRNIDGGESGQQPPWDSQNYSPDLTPSENPYYYESNRLLFALYVERQNRSESSSGSSSHSTMH